MVDKTNRATFVAEFPTVAQVLDEYFGEDLEIEWYEELMTEAWQDISNEMPEQWSSLLPELGRLLKREDAYIEGLLSSCAPIWQIEPGGARRAIQTFHDYLHAYS